MLWYTLVEHRREGFWHGIVFMELGFAFDISSLFRGESHGDWFLNHSIKDLFWYAKPVLSIASPFAHVLHINGLPGLALSRNSADFIGD